MHQSHRKQYKIVYNSLNYTTPIHETKTHLLQLIIKDYSNQDLLTSSVSNIHDRALYFCQYQKNWFFSLSCLFVNMQNSFLIVYTVSNSITSHLISTFLVGNKVSMNIPHHERALETLVFCMRPTLLVMIHSMKSHAAHKMH